MVKPALKHGSPATHEPGRQRLILLFAGPLVALGIFLCFRLVDFGPPLFFADDYVQRSKGSWLRLSFYTADRPFTTDLFYKLWGSSAAGALLGNQVFSVGCWTFLGCCFAWPIRRMAPALALLLLFASASLWWNIAGWTRVMLSESITFSLFALWYGHMVLMARRPRIATLIGLLLVTFFFSFTKDSVAYFLLGFALATALWFSFSGKPRAVHPLWTAYLGGVLLTFALQAATARVKNRHAFPLINVMLQRVLPDESKLAWFEERGAPLQALKGDDPVWEGAWASSHEWAIYGEPRYAEFKAWILGPGRYTYARYLLTHPREAILDAWRDRKLIYSHGLVSYTGPQPKSPLMRMAAWIWNPSRTFLIFGLLILYLVIWSVRPLPTLPLILVAGSLGHGLLIYHADAMEIPRHSLLVAVGLHLAFLQALIGLAGWLAPWRPKKGLAHNDQHDKGHGQVAEKSDDTDQNGLTRAAVVQGLPDRDDHGGQSPEKNDDNNQDS